MANKTQFSYDARKHFGTLSERKYRTLELNAIAYNGAEEAKYDLRRWLNVEGGKKMGKGITMDADELRALRDLLNCMEDI